MKKTTRKYLIATAVMLVGVVFFGFGKWIGDDGHYSYNLTEERIGRIMEILGFLSSIIAASDIDYERKYRK